MQGNNVATALEHLIRASHLNLTKNLQAMVGAQMVMQSSVFGRLGGVPFAERSYPFLTAEIRQG